MIMPIDIENKVFKKSRFSGYNIDDVEEFLEDLIVDYEELYKQNTELKGKITILEDSLNYYKVLESGIDSTLQKSEKIASEIKEDAINEASEIKSSAITESNYTLEELKLEIRAKELEYEQIKKNMDIYKIKVSSMLDAQLKILNEED
ncbi:MAG: DivIVA domain-containing protein [Clostridia bacterium]